MLQFDMERFLLTKSALTLSGWVLEDKESGLVCSFEAHKFNETQEWSCPNKNGLKSEELAQAAAKAAREAGDWIRANAYFVAMPYTNTGEFNAYIAEQVRCARLAKGWSKYRLSKEAGVNESSIGYIESGKHSVGSELLMKLAEAMGTIISIL